ncbi:anhydro-N-acetylmuramic acid kinase [Pedobacter sp. GR22-6]|uniref:anhydro-N-acetylmuramic acid kinase n=1 Tax=Pedobacter sp. GR22-6 TaxID=3127957 RepID=UPI00307F323E
MNKNWNRVFEIINKPERIIIGLMSGTSLDGLDIALCAVNGNGIDTRLEVLKFETFDYSNEFKMQVKSIFAKRDADLQMVCLMNEQVALQHAELILEALSAWGIKKEEVDVIASHGQTIYHAPKSFHGLPGYPNGTLQIGDGDHIAVKTGILTISDFRQKHIAAGGEGAPLALYGDYLLFSKAGEDRIMLNIGGIANFTYLPGDQDSAKVCSTDVGPGNTLMDQYVQRHFEGLYYDENAAIARTGQSNPALLEALLEHEFLSLGFPKTTGPELFSLSYLEGAMTKSETKSLARQDVLATLCCFSAEVIIRAINQFLHTDQNIKVYMSGGGMHNPLLVSQLKAGLPLLQFHTTESLGINPDAKESVLFALLANETLVGSAINFGDSSGAPAVYMGKISLPG